MERVLLFPHFVPWQRNIPSEFIIFYYQRDDAMFIHYPPRFIATRNRMLSRFKVARNISNCMCYVHVWKKYWQTSIYCVSTPCSTGRFCRISPRQQSTLQLRHSLHWLTVQYRTDFKLATLCFSRGRQDRLSIWLNRCTLMNPAALSVYVRRHWFYSLYLTVEQSQSFRQTSFLNGCVSCLEQFTCRTQNWLWLTELFQ